MTPLFKVFLLLAVITLYPLANARISSPSIEKKRILFVCTSASTFNGVPNGTFLSELCVPFILFHELGYEIDIVSPKGGAIPIYYKFDTTEVMQIALNSPYYQHKIASSLTPKQVRVKNYIAIIIPGGYGQFTDVHANDALNKIINDIYENNGFIGTLGHGASSLVNVKNNQDDFLVKGKTMTCFPSWFEKEIMTEARYSSLLPFDMEVELKKRGADLKQVDKETYSNREIIDANHRLVTAAFSDSGAFIVENLYILIKEHNK